MQLNRIKNTYFILGIIFLGILVLIALLINLKIINLSYATEPLVSAIFGWGGIILVILGILKAVFQKKKIE